ncbi:MAG: germination protein YpeB [Oscillospiraceae bacterium]|nr:germination protein YpeB [Oscillospiraceae bacterium]
MYRTRRMSRRGFVRLISFLTAGCIAFAIMASVEHGRNGRAQRQIENNYSRSLENLAFNVESIKEVLSKGIYSNSPQMLNELSGKLTAHAANARLAISQLPVSEVNLEQTKRFLSQVGNYSHSLVRQLASGGEVSSSDRDNLSRLLDYAQALSEELWEIDSMVTGGYFTFSEVFGDTVHDDDRTPHLREGFTHLEELFGDGYPALSYDGPFSDHIITGIQPRMLKGKDRVDSDESLRLARSICDEPNLELKGERGGLIPMYVYRCGDTMISITKDGGILANLLKYRRVGEKEINSERAIELAGEFLEEHGFENMVHTYHSLNGGICTIKFASEKDDVLIHTDLIKVGVALDNGEIMSFDSTPKITAHHERDLPTPKISQRRAREGLSSELQVQNQRLAVIPTAGQNEVLCYEFTCLSSRGNQVIVYVNALTGEEEQILLVRVSDNGTIAI